MAKKQWSDLSTIARSAIVHGAFAELIVTAVALRDLLHRPAAQVRGPKALWGVGLFVQPVGFPSTYSWVGAGRGEEIDTALVRSWHEVGTDTSHARRYRRCPGVGGG
jgi:hypothetical protein